MSSEPITSLGVGRLMATTLAMVAGAGPITALEIADEVIERGAFVPDHLPEMVLSAVQRKADR